MKTTFLGQGFSEESPNGIGYYLMKFLSSKDFTFFTAITAFASEAGVCGLSCYIESAKENFENLTIIVGVDQNGTSKEALEEILNLNINSFIFHQEEPPIFHPKIYLFEGKEITKLIIGSSNMTGRGLFTNVESSLLLEFDNEDIEGVNLIKDLKTYYSSLFDFTDPNLFKISDQVITDFIAKGIVPDEITRIRIYKKREPIVSQEFESNPIQKRITSKIPYSFHRKSKRTENPIIQNDSSISSIHASISVPSQTIESLPNDGIRGKLVWQSGPLTERDLTIPKGSNTHGTGSMLFKKGLMKDKDQRHYFRDDVFSDLPWVSDTNPSTAHYERATTFIKLIIERVDHGSFPFILSHNTKTDSKSYLQKNSMTNISWGKAQKLIAKDELIGKSANLYKSLTTKEYTLEIG